MKSTIKENYSIGSGFSPTIKNNFTILALAKLKSFWLKPIPLFNLVNGLKPISIDNKSH